MSTSNTVCIVGGADEWELAALSVGVRQIESAHIDNSGRRRQRVLLYDTAFSQASVWATLNQEAIEVHGHLLSPLSLYTIRGAQQQSDGELVITEHSSIQLQTTTRALVSRAFVPLHRIATRPHASVVSAIGVMVERRPPATVWLADCTACALEVDLPHAVYDRAQCGTVLAVRRARVSHTGGHTRLLAPARYAIDPPTDLARNLAVRFGSAAAAEPANLCGAAVKTLAQARALAPFTGQHCCDVRVVDVARDSPFDWCYYGCAATLELACECAECHSGTVKTPLYKLQLLLRDTAAGGDDEQARTKVLTVGGAAAQSLMSDTSAAQLLLLAHRDQYFGRLIEARVLLTFKKTAAAQLEVTDAIIIDRVEQE